MHVGEHSLSHVFSRGIDLYYAKRSTFIHVRTILLNSAGVRSHMTSGSRLLGHTCMGQTEHKTKEQIDVI